MLHFYVANSREILNIRYNDFVMYPSDIKIYFKHKLDLDKWLNLDIVKDFIYDVDKSEVLSAQCINSPVFGQIPPEKLSGGVKSLICMLQDDDYFLVSGTNCGDNCMRWIKEIADYKKLYQLKDLIVPFYHVPDITGIPIGYSIILDNYNLKYTNPLDLQYTMGITIDKMVNNVYDFSSEVPFEIEGD